MNEPEAEEGKKSLRKEKIMTGWREEEKELRKGKKK